MQDKQVTKQDIYLELEWRRCKADIEYWIENYVHIRVPGRGRTVMQLRDAQRDTLRVWGEQRYTITLKARQIGFSTLVAVMLLHEAMFTPDQHLVMLSKGEREARKLFAKSKYAWKHLPHWMKEKAPNLLDDNMEKMSWDNDSVIESLPSGSDPARGEAVDAVVVDEWAFLLDPDAAWASIEPITDIGGRVIGISTANGSGNFFHEFYVAAKTGASQFDAIFYPWSANHERDEDWYKAKKGSMTTQQLHQEYPRDDEECFIKSGNPVFDTDELRLRPTFPPVRGLLSPAVVFNLSDEGELHTWLEGDEPDPGGVYVIGADVAEGLEFGDFSSAHVIDVRANKVVAKWRGHVDPDIFGSQVLKRLGQWFGGCLIGVESNNHGMTTCMYLRDSGYDNLYWRTTYDERTTKQQRKIGWYTSQATKPMMIDALNQSLRDGLQVPDAQTIGELVTYKRNEKGRMSGSPFDDQVISLGIANQMVQHAFVDEYKPKQSDYGTFQWYERQAEDYERSRVVGRGNGMGMRKQRV